MSLLWRRKLRISIAADRLVLRAHRSRTRTLALQSDPNQPEWRAALEALPEVLAVFRNHDVSIVLADQFVRYTLLAWNAALKVGLGVMARGLATPSAAPIVET